MYVYIKSEPTLWTVGFYDPEGAWVPESDWSRKEDAALRVHFLNGGQRHPSPAARIDEGPGDGQG